MQEMFLLKLFQMKIIQNYSASVLNLLNGMTRIPISEVARDYCQNRVEVNSSFQNEAGHSELHWIKLRPLEKAPGLY